MGSCQDYVYRSEHTDYLARRRELYERMDEAWLVAWWVPAGHYSTLDEAEARLEMLRDEGPSERAFTFKTALPPPAS